MKNTIKSTSQCAFFYARLSFSMVLCSLSVLLGLAGVGKSASVSKNCLPPPAGLVSWWSGDKTADDIQGISPGELVGQASYTRGIVGPGFIFGVNADDRVQVGDTPTLKMTTAMTLECWILPIESINARIIANREGEYELSRWADGTIRWAFANTDPGWTWITTGFVAPLNTWTHVAVTYDSGLITTYGNGVQVHQYQGSGSIGDTEPLLNDFRIGNRQAFPDPFVGMIDELKVYNQALSSSEVAAIYAAGSNGNCKPEIFVTSIAPTYTFSHSEYSISTSISIQDTNGSGIQDVTVQVGVIFPDGQNETLPMRTDEMGQGKVMFSTTSTGLYKFKVRKVSHPTRDYDPALNIETSDTLVIP